MRILLMQRDTPGLAVAEVNNVLYNDEDKSLYCFMSPRSAYGIGPMNRTEATDIQLALFRDGAADMTQYSAELFDIEKEEV